MNITLPTQRKVQFLSLCKTRAEEGEENKRILSLQFKSHCTIKKNFFMQLQKSQISY